MSRGRGALGANPQQEQTKAPRAIARQQLARARTGRTGRTPPQPRRNTTKPVGLFTFSCL